MSSWFFLSASSIAESDVIRLSDPNAKLPHSEMRALLAKADLVSAGFTRTEETQIIMGEDGKKQKKAIIYYTVQDSCSNVSYWEEIIRARLPTFSKALTSKVVNEVGVRTGNRATEYCRFGIEVHYNICSQAEKFKEKAKRELKRVYKDRAPCLNGQCCCKCCCCKCCCSACAGMATIKYLSAN